MNAGREMTLNEWVAQLPPTHGAKKELDELRRAAEQAHAGELPPLPEPTRCHSYSCCHRNVYTADQMREYRLAGGVTVDDAAIHRAADAYATSLAERYGEGDGDIVAMRAAVAALVAK